MRMIVWIVYNLRMVSNENRILRADESITRKWLWWDLPSWSGIILCVRPANERRRYCNDVSYWLGAWKKCSLMIAINENGKLSWSQLRRSSCGAMVEKLVSWRLRGQCMAWWRHQTETFSASLALCAGNSPVPGEFPTQMPVTRNFDVFFNLRLNKRLSKQAWGWWFETPSRPLWRHRNGMTTHNSCDVEDVVGLADIRQGLVIQLGLDLDFSRPRGRDSKHGGAIRLEEECWNIQYS